MTVSDRRETDKVGISIAEGQAVGHSHLVNIGSQRLLG